MPEKDPQNYSLLAYLAFGGLSVWGGLVTYIQTVKREGRQFRWFEALLQIVVSGFAGMVIPPFFGALKSRGHAACAKRCFGV
ncbi:phage holin family protein [Aeromonas salmonicida]|uniref:phage holin family protein n=1 Tax=Aeromonas salmonicida TaxID=645 RepID=UPI002240C6A2|nr:phage holin family protein [Aeromonas salmonicida]MDF8330569.1 phage holin family protein [Aeromonas salmonicida]